MADKPWPKKLIGPLKQHGPLHDPSGEQILNLRRVVAEIIRDWYLEKGYHPASVDAAALFDIGVTTPYGMMRNGGFQESTLSAVVKVISHGDPADFFLRHPEVARIYKRSSLPIEEARAYKKFQQTFPKSERDVVLSILSDLKGSGRWRHVRAVLEDIHGMVRSS